MTSNISFNINYLTNELPLTGEMTSQLEGGTLLDEEERLWAKKLGDRDYCLERMEEDGQFFYTCYVRYQGDNVDHQEELYRLDFLDERFTDWVDENQGDFREDLKESLLKTIHQYLKWLQLGDVPYNFGGGQYGLPLFSNVLSQRQLLECIRNQYTQFLMCYHDRATNLMGRGRWMTGREMILTMQHLFSTVQKEHDGQSLINAIFRKVGSLADLRASDRQWIGCNGHVRDTWMISSLILPFVTADQRENAKFILQHAVVMNRPECVELALNAYPDLIAEIAFLVQAIRSGQIDIARLLVERGMPVNYQGTTSIMLVLINLVTSRTQPLSEGDKKLLEAFAWFLLKQGARINGQYRTDTSSDDALSMVEHAYFYRGTSHEVANRIARRLLMRGAKITARMATDMKYEIQRKSEFTSIYLHCLQSQGLITPKEEEILSLVHTGGRRDQALLTQEAYTANLFLEEVLKRFHLNPSLISIDKIREIRALKKEIKGALSQEGGREKELLEQQFTQLKKNWNALTTLHFLLRELKELKIEFKAQKPTQRFLRFFSLFGPNATYGLERAKEHLGILFGDGGQRWKEMIDRVLIAAKSVEEDTFLHHHQIVWLHGTKSSSLPLLLKERAVAPMGDLLARGVAPLCGEICGSESSLNKEDISGEMLSSHWEEGEYDDFYFDASTRLLINLLYASKEKGYHFNENGFDPEKVWLRATAEFLNKIIHGEVPANAWSVLRVDILRLRMTDREADSKLLPLKGAVEKRREETTNQEIRDNLGKLLHALTSPIAHTFTAEELEMIKTPYPIILGSTTADPIPFPDNYCVKEHLFHGRAELGQDIQIAFTLAEKVEELQQLLRPLDVRVYPFDSAFYAEFKQMARGSRLRALRREPLHVQIAEALQHDILPHYSIPLPKVPHFVNSQRRSVPVPAPFFGVGISDYSEYKKLLEEGRILPRSIHGPIHSTRAVLWGQALAEIYKFDPSLRLLLATTVGAHDCLREDEGEDRWDRESAVALKNYLLSRGESLAVALEFSHAIAEKDPADGQFTTDAQRIVHDADVFEIKRCLRENEKFDSTQLCLSKLDHIDFKEELTSEIGEFIEITENFALKKHLEYYSDNYYGDLVRLLKTLHDEKQLFPILTQLLAEPIKQFGGTPLDDRIHTIIFT
jgi:hypothetical protein